jgi:magnesium transporter
LDELAIEDVHDDIHYPKVDEFEGYLFVVLHGIAEIDGRLGTSEVDAFVGVSYLITFRAANSVAADRLIQRMIPRGSAVGVGPDELLARLAEVQGRRFLPVVTELDLAIDDLEDRAIAGDPDVLAEVQALRGDAARLRRVVGPLRDTLQELSDPLSDLIGPEARDRFASVYDHHYRLVESLDAARTMLGAVLDTYRSTVSERMNEVMKVLTVYTAILLPLSLIAGIYGMNFSNMPELGWRSGYFALLGLMAVIAIGQWIYFVRRGFIGRFRPERAARSLGTGLVKVARLPFDAASQIARDVGSLPNRRSRQRDDTGDV